MEVQLPAFTKAKLVRQVLVQKERFYQVPHNRGQWWTAVSETISVFLLKAAVLIGIERGKLFSYPIIFLAFGVLRALSIHLSSFPCMLGPYPFI